MTRPAVIVSALVVIGAPALAAAYASHSTSSTTSGKAGLLANTTGTGDLIVSGGHHTSQLCVDDYGDSHADGARVQVWPCDSRDPAQNWTINSGGAITINGKCLDVVRDDDHADLESCDSGISQQWTVTNGTVVSTVSGQCLTLPGWGAGRGARLEVQDCDGRRSQKWTPVGAGTNIGTSPSASSSPSTSPSPRPRPSHSVKPSPSITPTPTPTPSTSSPSTSTGTGTQPLGAPGNWTMAFDDEFNGNSVNTSEWAVGNGGQVNGVSDSPSNVWQSDGDLNLQLSSSSSGAAVCSGGTDTPCGGSTPGGYALPVGGFAEARVWFPGSGSNIYNWPAWWVSGADWPDAGEADIAEGLGDLTVNYHSPSGTHNHGTVSGTWSAGWHVYGIYRGSSSDSVYWDGKLVKTFPTDDNGQPEALIVDVGDSGGGVYGAASVVKVDYVRVWKPA